MWIIWLINTLIGSTMFIHNNIETWPNDTHLRSINRARAFIIKLIQANKQKKWSTGWSTAVFAKSHVSCRRRLRISGRGELANKYAYTGSRSSGPAGNEFDWWAINPSVNRMMERFVDNHELYSEHRFQHRNASNVIYSSTKIAHIRTSFTNYAVVVLLAHTVHSTSFTSQFL